MRNNIPWDVVCCAGNVPVNVVHVADQGSQPPGCVEHPNGCSATRVAPRSTRTRTRLDDDLRSPIQQGGGSRPPDGVSAARRPPILVEMPQFYYRITLGSPPWKRRGRGEDRRKPISIRSKYEFILIYCVFNMCTKGHYI